MSQVIVLLRDRKRRQHGGVLSGVLFITAFLAIIAGALMTELSTDFLLSRVVVHRVANQAAVNSAIELAFDSIQSAPLDSACPKLASAPPVNGLRTLTKYISCALVVDAGSPEAYEIASSAPFTIDGIYSQQTNEYMVPDSEGTLFAFRFGAQTPAWTYSLGRTPTGQPLAIAAGNGAMIVVPTGSGAVLLNETAAGQNPSFGCRMSTNSTLTARPAAGRNVANVFYLGDQSGTLYAFNRNCGRLASRGIADGQRIVAGPLVFPGPISNSDRLFFVVSDGDSSTLVQYQYRPGQGLTPVLPILPLLVPAAVGIAVDTTSLANGARLAITFSGGQVRLVTLSSSYGMTLAPQIGCAANGVCADAPLITKPPAWCTQCMSGLGLIGVGSRAGMYVLDASLSVYAFFSDRGPTPSSPVADAAGDWFIGGANGNIYELLAPTRGRMTLAHTFAAASRSITSSPVMNPCGTSLCIYLGARDSKAYLIPLDAREAILSSCVTNGQPRCSDANPQLWAHVEIGSPSNPRSVRVTGWSYYSP